MGKAFFIFFIFLNQFVEGPTPKRTLDHMSKLFAHVYCILRYIVVCQTFPLGTVKKKNLNMGTNQK
jgi:hypothetical protein